MSDERYTVSSFLLAKNLEIITKLDFSPPALWDRNQNDEIGHISNAERMENFCEALSKCTKVTEINFSFNSLANLPPSLLSKLVDALVEFKLNSLVLSYNELGMQNPRQAACLRRLLFSQVETLKTLDMSYNCYKPTNDLPQIIPSFSEAKKLCKLYLEGNNIADDSSIIQRDPKSILLLKTIKVDSLKVKQVKIKINRTAEPEPEIQLRI